MALSVSVTAGVLGVALVTVTLGGANLLSGALSAAAIALPSILGNATLHMAAGLYAISTYTLAIP